MTVRFAWIALDRLGIALVGAGFIADYHLGGLADVAGADVRVVASRTPEKAREVGARHGVRDATDDVSAAIRRPDVAAVIVATPDDTHEALAVEAMRAGRAVLLQKPMAPTSSACRRILAVAAETGCDLQVSWMHRHFEEIATARVLLAEGAVGRVISVRVRNATPGPDWGDWFFRSDVVGGGVVLQLGTHGIDLIGHLFGRDRLRVRPHRDPPAGAAPARRADRSRREPGHGARRLRGRGRPASPSRDVDDRACGHGPLPHGDLRRGGRAVARAPSAACSRRRARATGTWTAHALPEAPLGAPPASAMGGLAARPPPEGADRRRRSARASGRRGDRAIGRARAARGRRSKPA